MKECYRHTNIPCEECGHEIVMDVFKTEYYCSHCGLLMLHNMTSSLNFMNCEFNFFGANYEDRIK